MNISFIKKTLKPIASQIYGSLVANHPMLEKSLTIFCFHDVSDNPSEFSKMYELSVTKENFEFQINFISEHFNTIGSDQLIEGNIPEKAAMITFDDGFKSYFTNAIPLLEKYNLPSINFLNFATIKGEVSWAGLIMYLCHSFEDFYKHVSSNSRKNIDPKSYHLHCSREIVNSYLQMKNKTFTNQVNNFVGNFAELEDLQLVSNNNKVHFGNHLYNHDVSLLMTDQELKNSYNMNKDALKSYKNYRNFFAFPFGQPNTSFSNRQTDLLFNEGADYIFTGCSKVNIDTSNNYLHRIALTNFNNTEAKIWFSILRNSLAENSK
tara:strand:+ start:2011 stop:2973 length:963 start_codon:yes stop_codon:yes gene_type:complete